MLILLAINIIFLSICLFYYFKNKNKIKEQYIEKRKKEFDLEAERAIAIKKQQQQSLDDVLNERNRALQLVNQQLKNSQEQQQIIDRNLDSYESIQRNKIDSQIREYEQQQKKVIELNLQNESARQQKIAEEKHQQLLNNFAQEEKIKQNEIELMSQQLESFRAKQESINQEILRRRELEEKTNFYRVCLSDEAIADINLLQVTRQNLKKPEIIDKIIYDNYVAKPVLEMIKRVLQNSTCSGIYKITCQETKEIYIGKSTDVKNRWQQHCKTAFTCGTIASSVLHRKMQQYGLENFTFELLEKVPKEQLSEREKYYIDFYQTKEYGLNEKRG